MKFHLGLLVLLLLALLPTPSASSELHGDHEVFVEDVDHFGDVGFGGDLSPLHGDAGDGSSTIGAGLLFDEIFADGPSTSGERAVVAARRQHQCRTIKDELSLLLSAPPVTAAATTTKTSSLAVASDPFFS